MKKNPSIKSRLIHLSMTTSLLVLLISAIGFVSYTFYLKYEGLNSELKLLSSIIASRSGAAIEWGDVELADSSLENLQVKDSIIFACIYDGAGELFTSYQSSGEQACPPRFEGKIEGSFGHIYVSETVYQAGDAIGTVLIASDLRDIYGAVPRYLLVAGIVMTIAGFIAFWISNLSQREISEPVSHLTLTAKNVMKGNYKERASAEGVEEISTLAGALNAMLDVIQDRDEKLTTSNQQLEERVRQRTIELEHALEVKSRFLSNMSHEMRTPIHGVYNFSSFLVNDWDSLPEERKRHFIATIQTSSKRLISLVNDILDLAKLDSKDIQFSMGSHNLVTMVNNIMQEIRPVYFGKKELELTVDAEAAEMIAECDGARLEQVLTNLYSNAIKFTEKGTIHATLCYKILERADGRKMDGVEFALSDEGVGIPKGEEEFIFERFSESSLTRNGAGGTGLGLSICRNVVEGHHGKIWAENNADKGATLRFIIPLKQSA